MCIEARSSASGLRGLATISCRDTHMFDVSMGAVSRCESCLWLEVYPAAVAKQACVNSQVQDAQYINKSWSVMCPYMD